MDVREFQLFGLPHKTALAATVVGGIALLRYLRSSAPEARKDLVCKIGGLCLLLAVAADPVLSYIRYGTGKLIETSLPFYLCDVASILLAIALIFKKQRSAELGYFWGLAGTVQGLVTPTLYFSWDTAEYYAFFVQHGGVPVAAVALAFGAGLGPEKGGWTRAVCWSWVYIGAIYCLNLLLGTNYGFINAKPEVASLMDYMGPWPWYLLTLQAIAFTLYFLLYLPFWRKNVVAAA